MRVDSGRPPQNGSNTGAATVDGTLCGKPFHGAARDVNHFPSFGRVNGVAIIFASLGSIRVRFEANAITNGKEGVNGSSPSEGLKNCDQHFVLSTLNRG